MASGQQSDHLGMAAAVAAWLQVRATKGRREAGVFARQHVLDETTLEGLADVRVQLAELLVDAG